MHRSCSSKLLAFVVAFLMLPVTLPAAQAQTPAQTALDIPVELTFILPASLRTIDSDAFRGTAASAVVLSENAEYIGDTAFADMPHLRFALIPESVTHIADSSFSPSDELTIIGQADSYADQWARTHRFLFFSFEQLAPTAGGRNPFRFRQAMAAAAALALLNLAVLVLGLRRRADAGHPSSRKKKRADLLAYLGFPNRTAVF